MQGLRLEKMKFFTKFGIAMLKKQTQNAYCSPLDIKENKARIRPFYSREPSLFLCGAIPVPSVKILFFIVQNTGTFCTGC